MSVLDTPRIYFRGEITWDPIVTNNYSQLYDIATSKPVLGNGTVADYRELARTTIPGGNWNVHGTHRSTLFETTVTGVDVGNGTDRTDPLVGAGVSFAGKLVDLNPYLSSSSQLFYDDFSCGIQGGSQILGKGAGPMVARRINFARNSGYRVIAGVASVIWQASIPTEQLTCDPHGSPAVTRLRDLIAGDGFAGLTIRMNAYRTVYYNSETDDPAQAQKLAADIAGGGFHPNPARGLVVGVVGPWRHGEPPSVPGDRVLNQVAGSKVATAFARTGDGRVVIDLSNSVQETSFKVDKDDLGPLELVAKQAGGDVQLGTLEYADYNKDAYEATSGIVTLQLTDAQQAAAETADLILRRTNGAVLLREQALTAAADVPNLYLEQGEQATVSLTVRLRGRPPGGPVSVMLAEIGGPLPAVQVTTDDTGRASVPINGGTPGSWIWVLLPWQGQPPTAPAALNPGLFEYLTLRTTPADDDIAALEPTWDNVHANVLRYWEALAPCMDNWLRLGDEQQCAAYARIVKRLTSRDRFDRYGYMPVTRELTRGQRTLLHRWCDTVGGAAHDEAPAAAGRHLDLAADVSPTAAARDVFGRGF